MSVAKIEELLQQKTSSIRLTGLAGSAKAYVISQLIHQNPSRMFVYLAGRGKEALEFQKDVNFFLQEEADRSLFFPPSDVLPFSQLSPHPQISCQRLKTLYTLLHAKPVFLSTTAAALLTYLPPPALLKKAMSLKIGEEIPRDLFLETLLQWGYQSSPVVSDPGQVAVRGAVMDVFCPLESHPLRIEWMGDTVDSLRFFDPKTQRSLAQKESPREAVLIPAREIILNAESKDHFAREARQKAEEKNLSRSAWHPFVEKVRSGVFFQGAETYLPFFYKDPTTFWDWLPPSAVVVTDETVDGRSWQQSLEEYREDVATLAHDKDFFAAPEEVLISPNAFEESKLKRSQLIFSVFSKPPFVSFETETHEDIRTQIEKSKKTVNPLAPLIQKIQERLLTDRVVLVGRSSFQTDRLKDLLTPHFSQLFSASSFRNISSQNATLILATGELTQGFRLVSDRLTIITDEEIFGPKVHRASRDSFSGSALSSFAELKKGDPLVHKEHGIGLYCGMAPLEINGHKNDFILIEYQGGDKLYLPVYRLNQVQRYSGAEKAPRLDKMGGASWSKIRGKAEKVIRQLAGELLNLYAARSVGQGFSFSPPNELFEAFEASFPYEETVDQEHAIQEVLKDMQSARPMDRLVLGDVGYGKTEVALRAAFKAVLDGKQVAFLVPTTLLALQHYERFLQRFRDYPVNIDMLSRFRTAADQKKTVQALAQGKVDVLIGTHRLLQPDLSFKDLGLLIIDEEHRFGVEQKEKMKRLRKNVDVLALSATPIPRTLYMSLVGIRAISVIETPPTDRLAIRTYVMPFDDGVIQEAIQRELKRGGQIFFVHNEIQTMNQVKEKILRIAPDVKIEIAHGQMDEEILEKIMIRFFHQEFNLLLCTTIIESGIDIPTANTIIIHQADRLGLAQIYQLRGRVGRGGNRAYAYLIVPEERTLTAEAAQRLSVLQRFSELGSGYKMASYDLEIRGAGNLLGTSQSGHMEAIGYELYTDLLEKAIRELKGEKVLDEIDPEIHFNMDAYLPEDYVPDPPVRLELYHKLASLMSEEEIFQSAEEWEDRLGPLPPQAQNLLELAVLRVYAQKIRIKYLRWDGNTFVYAFDASSPLPPDLLLQRIHKNPKQFRLTPDFRFTVNLPIKDEKSALKEAKSFLRELTLHLN